MNTERPPSFLDFVSFLVVVIPLVWFFAVVGFGGLGDQRRLSVEHRSDLAAEKAGGGAAKAVRQARRPMPKAPPKPLAIVIHEGKQAYNLNCVTCHQPGGVGKVGLAPDIHNPDFLAMASDDFIKKTIRMGRPGTAMAPWSHLTEDQVDGIIAYLRSESPEARTKVSIDPDKHYAGDPALGAPLYSAYCASCHGPRGEGYIAGGAGPGIGLAGFLAVASDDYIYQTVKVGRQGTPMKSFIGAAGLANLSDEEVGHIIAHLRELGRAPAEIASTTVAHVPDAMNGEAQFNINCAACHQAGGIGKVGFAPSIRNRDFLALASDEFIKQTVKQGRPGTAMVARVDLSDAILEDIIAYLRSVEVVNPVEIALDPGRVAHGDVGEGATKYGVYCASCHGPKGSGYLAGGSGPGIGLPGFLAAASDDYIYQTLKIGRIGTAMRPFLGARGVANLTDEDASDIITFLRSLNP